MAKKSLYIFLTALLGVLMFLLLDRIVIFFYLFLLAGNYITTGMSYWQFTQIDYFIMTLVMMLGAWYGIWLGLYWYRKVYEEQSHGGFIHHLSTHYFPGPKAPQELASLQRRLQTDLSQLEDIAQHSVASVQPPQAIKRKLVRKRAPRKLKSAQ